jgi:gamma-glutamylcyclotransferase (GGCT)/AIG2-like uncharacterized protein YtfP
MIRKFMSGKVFEGDPNFDYEAFRREPYFFYGTLMDPSTLAEVLHLDYRPQLKAAKLVGYSCKLWGPYPALVDGPPGAIVRGVTYEVESPEEKKRLEEYETDQYRTSACLIEFETGEQILGRVFKWNGDNSLLREGSFDLKDWQMKRLEMDS